MDVWSWRGDSTGGTRAECYTDWLKQKLGSVAAIQTVQVSHRKCQHVLRDHELNGRSTYTKLGWLPQADYYGELEIIDGPGFAQMLERGVGREKALGFGLLLLGA